MISEKIWRKKDLPSKLSMS